MKLAALLASVRAQIRPSIHAVMSPDERRIEFRIQRLLRSPNELLGRHWREKHRERAAWQADLTNALIDALGSRRVQQLLQPNDILPGCKGERPNVRRSVGVIRWTPSRRQFVRDDDNLRFTVKPLLDALKGMGLLRDDARKWADVAQPEQEVSNDGTAWTWIVVDDAAPLPTARKAMR